MIRSLVLKIGFIPVVATAAWVLLHQQPLKACPQGQYCDMGNTASAIGHGADCDAARSDAINQINAFLFSGNACGVGVSLCGTGPRYYDSCNFDGTQYSEEVSQDYGCGACY
jgi:hypothetical protein